MPNIYDNTAGKKLSDALEISLTRADSLDACVGYFNLRGWKSLDEKVENLRATNGPKARILIGMLDRPDQGELQKLRLSAIHGNSMIYDGEVMAHELESILDNFSSQLISGIPSKSDLQTLSNLSRSLKDGKIEIKAYLSQRLHAKLYLAHRKDDHITPRVAFVGSSNLTLAGLEGQGELNIDVHDGDATAKLSDWFEDKWSDINALDVSRKLAELIDCSWVDQVDPYLLHLKFAYYLSQEARDGNAFVEIPVDLDFKLLDFQKAAVKTAARLIQRNGGVMVADVVGLGKTLTATAIARVLEEIENVETLIICPKNLENMWMEYVREYKLRGARVVSLSVARTILPELGRYRLVIIDESHNLRNAGGQTYNAVKEYIAKNEPRVLLLTATPYNVNLTDIADQLALFVPLDKHLPIRPDQAINSAGGLYNFSKMTRGLSPNTLGAFRKSEFTEDWRNLLQYFMVRRTREFVKKNYALEDSYGRKYLEFPNNPGKKLYFPERVPHFLSMPDSDKEEKQVLASADLAGKLKLARQGLGNYLFPNVANSQDPLIRDIRAQRQTLQGLTRTNLVKRRSSSPAAFSLTLQRHLVRDFAFIYAIQNHLPLPIGAGNFVESEIMPMTENDIGEIASTHFKSGLALLDVAGDGRVGQVTSEQAAELGKFAYERISQRNSESIRWADSQYFDGVRLLQDLHFDVSLISEHLKEIGDIDPKEDSKISLLYEKIMNENKNKKILIFSEYQDTVKYIQNSLANIYGVQRMESVKSSTSDIQGIVRRFSPNSNGIQGGELNPNDEIQYLISTDVLSEGQNLQDANIIVNFDLPWALIRLVQRAGRIDRLGQESDKVHVYVIDPSAEVNRQISLRQRLQERLIQAGAVLGGDDRFFGSDLEAQTISDLLTGSNVLELEDPQDVDPSSYAYEIWRQAILNRPELKDVVIDLPLASRSTLVREGFENSGAVYSLVNISGRLDISTVINSDGTYSPISGIELLRKTSCDYRTGIAKALDQHFDFLQILADGAIESSENGTAAMVGTRKLLYEAVRDHPRLAEGTIFSDSLAREALQSIYSSPLTELSKTIFSQSLKHADADILIDKMSALHSEGTLVVSESELESGAFQLIGSIGIRGDKK